MQAFIASKAFIKVPCSYDSTIPYLEFVGRNTGVVVEGKVLIHKIPIRYIGDRPNRPTMLVCHGNGEDIGHTKISEWAQIFDINICIFDYAGYGLHSCPTSSENACYQDVAAVYRYLLAKKNVDPKQIILWGRSLGTAVACHLAHSLCASTPPLGLILVSPMLSAVKIVMNIDLPDDMFTNYILAPKITCPTLVLHGDKDPILPYSGGVELSRLFPKLTKFVTLTGCDHDDVWTPVYYEEIKSFVAGNGI